MAEVKELIRLAYEAQKKAYVPYSGFRTGAALEAADGRIFTGCNIENAAYTPTNCAERTAFFKAVSEGAVSFSRIAIVGELSGGEGRLLRALRSLPPGDAGVLRPGAVSGDSGPEGRRITEASS